MRVAPLRIFAASKEGKRSSPTFTVNRTFPSSKRVLERRHYAITASEFYSPFPLATLGHHPPPVYRPGHVWCPEVSPQRRASLGRSAQKVILSFSKAGTLRCSLALDTCVSHRWHLERAGVGVTS
ncbi:hypothetical protein IscW_ISCW004284 [Ixodes scapularis]|uniref:Uncharacterized protein n=1 Tax=Ixodes scapularis TaxID=6945 RepID=B7PF49_IXOSC|nr:hypothetical protein IscW_ISCW004284 [Ixodes scapularis]|eukprot:XP_002433821.1 hypothetical protein IscW_ISCW004284 [Ixodes scapularis]